MNGGSRDFVDVVERLLLESNGILKCGLGEYNAAKTVEGIVRSCFWRGFGLIYFGWSV